MAMKRPRGFVGANRLLHAIEEVRLEDVRLERRAGLARDDEQRAGEIDLATRARGSAPGSVESRTNSSGEPAIVPNVSFQTSGQRLDPPIPSSSAWVKPSLRTSC